MSARRDFLKLGAGAVAATSVLTPAPEINTIASPIPDWAKDKTTQLAHPVISGMLRVKNEARWLPRVLDSIHTLCNGGIFLFDDHSTDYTARIAQERGARVIPSPFSTLDEVRDKNLLLKTIMQEASPDWVLAIDGDEELEKVGVQQIRDTIASGKAEAYSLQALYLWDCEDQIRFDRIYGDYRRLSLFHTRNTDLQYRSTYQGSASSANLHCTNVPYDLARRSGTCPARLKHYGYLDRQTRIEKYEFYQRVDPGNLMEDEYRHIVQGDIPESPAWARLKWAGPLIKIKYQEPAVTPAVESALALSTI